MRITERCSNHSFIKVQKELKRKKKAKEKLDRWQGKKDHAINDIDEQKYSDCSTGYVYMQEAGITEVSFSRKLK
jgi:hypothetical protein